MALVLTVPDGQPNSLVELQTAGSTRSSVRALVLETGPLPSCTGVNGFTTAAINTALASGAAEVCFGPGVYEVTGTVTQSLAGQVLNFYPGAVLRFAASGLGKVLINGSDASIVGKPVARFDAASAVAYTAIDLHGEGASCCAIRFEPNANVTNCTLLKVSGDNTTLGEVTIEGVGECLRGVDCVHQDGSSVLRVETGRIRFFPIDDGATTRTYDSILRMICALSSCGAPSFTSGGRTRISSVVDCNATGAHNELVNPQFQVSNADFGIRMRDNAEFLNVYGGEIKGGYLAGSQGISCGNLAGQLKLFGTKITNWDKGLRFTGSCDAPLLSGATIANNKIANLEIDGGGVAPVSGLGLSGVYMESVAFPLCIPIHLKTGDAPGMAILNSQISSSDATVAAIEVAAGFAGGTECILAGNRFPQVPGASVTRPGANTRFWFGPNSFFGSNSISTGAFAANAQDWLHPVVTTLKTNTSMIVGTAGDPYFSDNSTFFTANFAAGIGALATVELDFAWGSAVINNPLYFGVNGALALNPALLFFAFVRANGTASLRAYNSTLVAVGPIVGSVFFMTRDIIP